MLHITLIYDGYDDRLINACVNDRETIFFTFNCVRL